MAFTVILSNGAAEWFSLLLLDPNGVLFFSVSLQGFPKSGPTSGQLEGLSGSPSG